MKHALISLAHCADLDANATESRRSILTVQGPGELLLDAGACANLVQSGYS